MGGWRICEHDDNHDRKNRHSIVSPLKQNLLRRSSERKRGPNKKSGPKKRTMNLGNTNDWMASQKETRSKDSQKNKKTRLTNLRRNRFICVLQIYSTMILQYDALDVVFFFYILNHNHSYTGL